MYKEDLAWSNLQWLICHKPHQTTAQLAEGLEYTDCLSAEG